MALDVSALEAALPAALIAAVTSSAGGLTNAGTQVYVARAKRASPQSPEGWFRPAEVRPIDGGLGHTRREFVYDLMIEKDGATAAELGAWARLVEAYFDGYRRPATTGHWAARSEGPAKVDLHEGEGPAAAVRLQLVFEEE